MLDTVTKHRIDTARDILVGKVPDPKSQVEQITIALIYKFMDDMDAESEELGGKRSFFNGEFNCYGWSKLMRAGLGGHEILNLYTEAITRMPENPGIPPLFRDIFNNAFLPYRDPETLRAFLKVIDEFTYDHSERLGDAFEYLLSVLGSQGDAGQFRTPRHIIEFIVAILDPKKDEKVLDPACGTAGFLISSYRHILKANTDDKGQSTLTPEEKGKLADNFKGYDISPDMVRLSLVNLYLHGIVAPHIFEYDTLTSDERWNDFADVILANPPFMSPKGGIRPHNRFSIIAKRSEVLFVDYMAEHLMPAGRAGIIVPEGIIFQSQKAYTRLRKMLVEDYLVAVVSLPAGVFNPYSSVKTSILILDKSLSKKTNSIAFFKIENDGYDLGAQRRTIDKNDLPLAQAEIAEYLRRLQTGEEVDDSQPAQIANVAEPGMQYLTDKLQTNLGLIVEKEKIVANGDYNLSGERYRETVAYDNLRWPMVRLRDICDDILGGGTPSTKNEEYWKGDIPWISSADIVNIRAVKLRKYITEKAIRESTTNLVPKGNLIVVTRVGLGKLFRNDFDICISQDSQGLIVKDIVNADYLLYLLKEKVENFKKVSRGSTIQGVTKKQLAEIQIPLPPLVVQHEIVSEIEGYQKLIDGAQSVVDNYKPCIEIDPEWPMVTLGDYFITTSGGTPSKAESSFWNGQISWVSPKDMKTDVIEYTEDHISEEAVEASATKLIDADSVICVVRSGILKHSFPVALLSRPMCINQDLIAFRPVSCDISSKFLFYVLKTNANAILREGIKPGVTVQSFYNGFFRDYLVPKPPPEVQQSIIAEIETEQDLVAANRKLIERFEEKIRATITRVQSD